MELFIKLFLRDKSDYVFGPGRLELLQAVEELGSLRQAAQKIGMSYRWAWGRIKDTENFLNVPLLVDNPEQGKRTKVLSQEAHELLHWYHHAENLLNAALKEAMQTCPECILQAQSKPKMKKNTKKS